MFIVNGICYAGTSDNNLEIVAVKPLDDKMMLLQFSSGEIRLFDAAILTGSAFQPLEDETIFRNPCIENGIVTWLNGDIDCAPEYMYKHSYAYDKAVSF